MTKQLFIRNKLISLKGNIIICDEHDEPRYQAKGSFAVFYPRWRLFKGEAEIASLRRKIFVWRPTWQINSELGDFIIKKKLLSWHSRYQVIGGPFDGAEINGNFWDRQFEISHQLQLLAQASGKIMSLRNRYTIELLREDDSTELFTAIVMVTMLMHRRDRQQNQQGR